MHGGSRPGAGRPLGSQNRKTREMAAAAIAAGMSPLEYLLHVMRDVNNPTALRLDAAKAAAPYVHPRLAQIHHANTDGEAIESNAVIFLGGVLAPKNASR